MALRYVIVVVVAVIIAGLVLALLLALVLAPLVGAWLGAAWLVGGKTAVRRHWHTLGFLFSGDVNHLPHYDSPTRHYPEEDVPAAIAEAHQYGYCVAGYALPGITPILDAAAGRAPAQAPLPADR